MEYGRGLIVSKDNIYITGHSRSSSGIATTGSFQSNRAGNYDAFLVKLNLNGIVQWGTYYGGPMDDFSYDIAANDSGYIYVTGNTVSNTGISTSGSYQPILSFGFDAYIIKFDSSGNRIWGTYYGGNDYDESTSIAVDNKNNVSITGRTRSTKDIASLGAHKNILVSGIDAFLLKFNEREFNFRLIFPDTPNSDTCAGKNKLEVQIINNDTIALQKIRLSLEVNDVSIKDYYWSGNLLPDDTSNVIIIGTALLKPGTNYISVRATRPNEGFSAKSSLSFLTDTIIASSTCINIHPKFKTFLGGEYYDNIKAIRSDKEGNIYVAGTTSSSKGIATKGTHKQTLNPLVSGEDAFLVKFNRYGIRLWGTYYGGHEEDVVEDMAIDDNGNLYLTGYTGSSNGIATSGAHQTSNAGSYDMFIAKFTGNGTLSWGTYFGGTSTDMGSSIVIGDSNYIYITGRSYSTSGIATAGAHQSSKASGVDAVLAKFSANGVLQWGTYIGGGGVDEGIGIGRDNKGNIIVAGNTSSNSGIATPNSYQNSFAGNKDIFISQFNQNGACIWSTYYGITNLEECAGITVDDSGYIYIAGSIYPFAGSGSTTLATSNAHQSSIAGSYDVLLSKFNNNGNLVWSTYYGGSGIDIPKNIISDSMGNVYLSGHTSSSSGIVTSGHSLIDSAAIYSIYNNAFVAKFNKEGLREFGTLYGGLHDDIGFSLALDDSNNLYLAGETYSHADIADSISHQPVQAGYKDGFIVRISDLLSPSTSDAGVISLISPNQQFCEDSVDVILRVYNFSSTDTLRSFIVNLSIDNVILARKYHSEIIAPEDTGSFLSLGKFYMNPGSYTFKVWTENPNKEGDANKNNDSIMLSAIVYPLPEANFMVYDNCFGDSTEFITIEDTAVAISKIEWEFGNGSKAEGFSVSHLYSLPGKYKVQQKVTTNVGCIGRYSDSLTIFPLPTVNSGADKHLCLGSSPIQLSGSPSTGYWTGNGVDSIGWFDSLYSVKSYKLTYHYFDSNGCYSSDTSKVTVHNSVFAGNDTAFCDSSGLLQLHGYPLGGSWSGSFVSNNKFSVAAAPPGTYYLVYTKSDWGCVIRDTVEFTVKPLPKVSTGADFSICVSTDSMIISATPFGGSWNSIAITDSVFYPVLADTGVHQAIYSYNAPNGCSQSDTIAIEVEPIISVGPDTVFCLYSNIFLPTTSPSGGILSGKGIYNDRFYPDSAGTGVHSISYTYNNNTACSSKDSFKIVVAPIETVFAGNDTAICEQSNPFTLMGFPSGGEYFGPGVTNNTFYPDSAGIGDFTITYNYRDSTLCEKTDNLKITVLQLPTINAGNDVFICPGNGPTLINAIPKGGNWSAIFPLSGNTFNTQNLAIGSYELVYNYTDSNQCYNADTINLIVDTSLFVDAGPDTAFCYDTARIALNGFPLGGTWTGNGVSSTYFYPSIAGTGIHKLYYTYGLAANCRKTDSMLVVVHALPTANAGPRISMCADDSIIALAGSPSGGFWSGSFIDSSGTFDPSVSGTGVFKFYYSITNNNGCSHLDSTLVTVNPKPIVEAGNDTTICFSSGAFNLVGSPAKGNWNGEAVVQNKFYPALSKKSSQTLFYSFSASGCISVDSFQIKVHKPEVKFFLPTEVCVAENAVPLVAKPPGGIFSGEAVVKDSLFPQLSTGTETIIFYSAVDSIGCMVKDSVEITIAPPPALSVGPDTLYCTNLPPLLLTAQPQGGNWSGTGVYKSYFYADSTGPGNFRLQYYYKDSNGCIATESKFIKVHTPPVANFYGGPQSGLFPLTVRFYDSSSANTGNWMWYVDSSLISTDKNPQVLFNKAGNYDISLFVMDTLTGCPDTITKNAYITITSGLESLIEAGIKIYPNPADNIVIVAFEKDNFRGGSAQLISSDGKLIKSLQISSNKMEITRGPEIKAGIYLVLLKSKDGKMVYATIMFK